MIDIEGLKYNVLQLPNYSWSSSTVLELITRLEAAESNQVLSASASQFKRMEDQLTVARENLMATLRKNDSLNEKLEAAEDQWRICNLHVIQLETKLEAAEQDSARWNHLVNSGYGWVDIWKDKYKTSNLVTMVDENMKELK